MPDTERTAIPGTYGDEHEAGQSARPCQNWVPFGSAGAKVLSVCRPPQSTSVGPSDADRCPSPGRDLSISPFPRRPLTRFHADAMLALPSQSEELR
jgi:hypothetical protein